jgi:protein required for attachment to host cells
MMAECLIEHDTYVLVGDGSKALLMRNEGDGAYLNLQVEKLFEQENPPTHEQGTNPPGRFNDGLGVQRSAVEQTDWHELEETRFANDVAEALYKRAHKGEFGKLVIVAPPSTLGDLRKALHKEVTDKIVGELDKDLTNHPMPDMEKVLKSSLPVQHQL